MDKTKWYIETQDKKGNKIYTLLPSILAKHIIETVPLINTNIGFYLFENGVYKPKKDQQIKTMIKAYLRDIHNPRQISDVFYLLDNSELFDPNILNNFNSNDKIINLKNCIIKVDKNNFKIINHNKDIKSTIQFNVEYDKNAHCELWIKIISEILDKEQIILLQEIMGYFLITNINAKKFFLLHGPTDCGKSKVLNVLKNILTDQNYSSVTLQNFCNPDLRFETSKLFGKIANICGDLPTKQILDTGTLKMLTGDDTIDAEKKGMESFNFRTKAKLIFSCNSLPPNYSDRSDAFYNRIELVIFKKQILKKDQDKHLDEKLAKEYPGILNWMLEGLMRLLKNDLNFSTPDENKQKIEEYKENNNPTLTFINEFLEKNIDGKIILKELYKIYTNNMEESGNLNLSLINFKSEIISHFANDQNIKFSKYLRHGNSRLAGFTGIKIKKNEYIDYEKEERKAIQEEKNNVIQINMQ